MSEAWKQQAACLGKDPALFFADGPDRKRVLRETAERFCRTCPVILACRDAGVGQPGLWGGRALLQRDGRRRS